MLGLFSKKSFLGIDISDYSVEILQLGQNKEVQFASRALLDAEVVKNGEVLSREILAERLKIILAEAPSRFPPVILGLPDSKVFFHSFMAAGGLPEPDLEKEISASIFKLIPADPESLGWDYFTTSCKGGQFVFFAAIDKEILKGYTDVMRLVGLEVAVVDVGSSALARALLSYPRAGNAVMIIDLGARATDISIFEDENIPLLSVTVPVGGSHFNSAIVKELKVSYPEADRLKRTRGFAGNKNNNSIFAVLEAGLENIIKEATGAVAYYEREGNKKVGEIILAGGSALLPKIEERLGARFKIPVSIGDPFKRVKKSAPLEKSGRAMLCVGAMGLALRGLDGLAGGINLLKNSHRKSNPVSDLSPKGKFRDFWSVWKEKMRFWRK